MSTPPTSEGAVDDTTLGRRATRWFWIVALVAVVAIGAAVLWIVILGSDEQPTLTYDGTSATYSGP